jgi:beta-galactosidase
MFLRRNSCVAPSPKRYVQVGLFLLCLLLGLNVLAQGRLVLNFNPDWKFIKADPSSAEQPGFNDADWTTVSTPHTFNDTDSFDFRFPGQMLGDTNEWSGRTWYRKTFTLPDSARGKKVYIEFEAVRQVAEVYLNGHLLGSCKNGFIPFGLDLTPYLQFGQPNVLAVMCDNRFMISHEAGAVGGGASNLAGYEKEVNSDLPEDADQVQANQIPWNNAQWHPPLGGIYRNVRLYVTDPLHICLPLYDFLKTVGPYAYATEISDASATLGIEVPVENGRANDEQIEVTADVLDRDGNTILSLKQNGEIPAGGQKQFNFSGAIQNPQLWEPDYPYFYHVVCSVRAGDQTVDTSEVPLGIRAVHWDINTGFSINGHHLKLHGWGQRPTDEWPGLGTAQPDWLHFFTLQLMKNAGGNFIRWGHCAAGADMIRAGDELGFVTDQPGVDGESDTVAGPWKIRAAAFRDVLIYFRNDPSILIWEGGNQKVTAAHAEELRHYFDEYDPHGGRAYAHRRADDTTGQFMDITIGTEGSHEVSRLPVVEGEYDREESPRRVWDDYSPPDFGYPQAKGQTYDLTSEQFAVNEVSQYVDKIGDSSHSGGANWIFSDSTSGGRNTAEVSRASGEVDGVRLPKEAYYVCQTMFRDDPQVHIIGHWNYSPGTKKTIYVTSNCSNVELFVNGKLLGTGQKSYRYLFTFPDIVFSPGEIKAIAYNDADNNPLATDAIHTAGPPVALSLEPITGPGGLQADGSDVALIDVVAVDANGQQCPTFNQRVDFSCDGPAIWRGGYNSGIPGSINQKFLNLECGINRVAVRSTLTPGDISVTATCPGLKSATIVIPSHSFPVADGYSQTMPAMPVVALAETHPDWSALAVATPPMTVTSAAENIAGARHFIQTFSYSGPTSLVHVEANAADGKNAYCDRDYAFQDLPERLSGADWVQTADEDNLYAAADLMQFAAKAGTMVYVAYDAALPVPDWLQNQFHQTTFSFTVNGRPMKVFSLRLRDDGSLTLGSNASNTQFKSANMYIVFAKPGGSRNTANR